MRCAKAPNRQTKPRGIAHNYVTEIFPKIRSTIERAIERVARDEREASVRVESSSVSRVESSIDRSNEACVLGTCT